MTVVLNDRYALRRSLGGGGMGRVYLAQDVRDRGTRLALKTLVAEADLSEGVDHLRREFLVLADLGHPHIVRVHDFGYVQHTVGEPSPGEPEVNLPTGIPFFTREYVRGVSLLQATARLGQGDILRLLLELTSAVHYLHRQGLLHRDLKPDNVMVTDTSADDRLPRVKLLDFGLAALTEEARGLPGNLRYVAPELILGRAPEPPADLYSLGLVFYEVFAGRPAFEGQTAAEVAKAQTTQEPPPLPSSVPAALCELVSALLHKEPSRRPTGQEVLERLDPLVPHARVGGDSLASSGTVRLAGRERELNSMLAEVNALVQAWRDPTAPPARALLLTGGPGIGKSRLLQSMRHEALVLGARVMLASCSPESDAFAGGRALLRPLLLERPDLITPEREVLRMVLSERPFLRLHQSGGDRSPDHALIHLCDAACNMLDALAREQPLLVVLEDLHWADPESLTLFRHLLYHLPARRALLVGSVWPSTQPSSPSEALLDDLSRAPGDGLALVLEGLEEGAIRLLVERTHGQAAEGRLVEKLRARTEGNPLFIEELLKLAPRGEALAELLEQDLLPLAVGDAFRTQLRALSGRALQALKGLAVWGVPAILFEVSELTGQERRECLEGLEEAVGAQLVREVDNRYWFWHHVLAHLVDELMSPEEGRELHLRAGQRRENVAPDLERITLLMGHFSRAGDAKKALGYAIIGARQAEARFLFRPAIEFLERAKELSLELLGQPNMGPAGLVEIRERLANLNCRTGAYSRAEAELRTLLEDPALQHDTATRARLRRALGDLALRRGEYVQALDHFQAALSASSSPVVTAELKASVAEVQLRQGGSPDEPEATCREALAVLGGTRAPRLRANLARLLGNCAQKRSDWALAIQQYEEAREIYVREKDVSGQAAVLVAIAEVHFYRDQYKSAWDVFLQALELQESLGDMEGVATTLDRLALASWGLGDTASAITYSTRSVDSWRRLRNVTGESKALATVSLFHHARGDYREALEWASQAIALRERVGDLPGLTNSFQNVGILYQEVGALAQAREALYRALELAVKQENRLREARVRHLLGAVSSAAGELEEAEAHFNAATTFFRAESHRERLLDVLADMTELALKQGKVEVARRWVDEALSLAPGLGRNPLVVKIHLMEGHVAMEEPQADLSAVGRHLDQAASLVGEMVGERQHPDLYWQLLEVKGRLALRLGRPREAARLLGRSMDVIRQCWEKLPEGLKGVYLGDLRRKAVREALEYALAAVRR